MTATANETFFVQGLHHYGTAVETVESFKVVTHAKLAKLVEARSWKHIKLDPKWRDDYSTYQRQTDIYVSISVGCRFSDVACSLELGLWWHREETSGVELYAGLHGAKDVKWRKNVVPLVPMTKRYSGQTSYLLRAVSGDVSDVAQSLLDELEDSAARAIKHTQ